MLDRWQIEFSEPEVTEEEGKGDPIPLHIINNYFSIGVVSHSPPSTSLPHIYSVNSMVSRLNVGRVDCAPVAHDARETPGKVQQSHAQQAVVLRVWNERDDLVNLQETQRKHRRHGSNIVPDSYSTHNLPTHPATSILPVSF